MEKPWYSLNIQPSHGSLKLRGGDLEGTEDHVHDNNLVDCVCWEVLEACMRRSQATTKFVEAHERVSISSRRAWLHSMAGSTGSVKTDTETPDTTLE